MFDVLKNLFSDERAAVESVEAFTMNDQHLCEAALMFHVIAADGQITDEERIRMKALLGEQYELSNEQLVELFEAAQKADSEAVDLYRFTSLLKKELDRDQRIAIIERLWEMCFCRWQIA